jgi:hypothetical protein
MVICSLPAVMAISAGSFGAQPKTEQDITKKISET